MEPFQVAAFHSVKDILTSNKVLVHFDKVLQVILACHASPYSVGTLLGHKLPDGREVPITYFSHTFSQPSTTMHRLTRMGWPSSTG